MTASSAASRGRRPSTPRRRRRVGRALWPVLATLGLVLVLFTAVFPTRTFLAQRSATSAAQERLTVLREQSATLDARAQQLRDDAEIERLAREQYNLVMPGEEAYAMLPAAPQDPPPAVVEEESDDRNPLERVWDGVTVIF